MEYRCRRSVRFAGVGGSDGVATGAYIFGKFELWVQPAELTEYGCDVCTWKRVGYRKGCTVWTLLDVLLIVGMTASCYNNTNFERPVSFGLGKRKQLAYFLSRQDRALSVDFDISRTVFQQGQSVHKYSIYRA